jgi:hypothetical protein
MKFRSRKKAKRFIGASDPGNSIQQNANVRTPPAPSEANAERCENPVISDGAWGRRLSKAKLLAQTETFDNLAIPIRVAPVEVIEQAAALIDHHDQTAPGRMIFHVQLEMRRQVIDAIAQQSYLHFGGTRVLGVRAILFNQH